MPHFAHAHATHPDARMAFALAAAQIDAQIGAEPPTPRRGFAPPTLGWLYLTDHLAGHAEAVLALARERWPGVAWVGAVGVGICASGVEYFDEPALALMLADLPRESFRVFSGAQPLPAASASAARGFVAHSALVHADPSTPELDELIADLAARTASGYLFGGLASARTRVLHIADDVLEGGLSGVAFAADVTLASRVTQGCQPIGPTSEITAAEGQVVLQLDGEHALDVLLADLGLADLEPRAALPKLRATLVGLSDARRADRPARRGAFGPDVRVRHLIGLDPARRGVAVAERIEVGQRLAFCTRHVDAARRDLTRICAEVLDEFEPADALSPLAPHVAPPALQPLPGEPAGGGMAAPLAGAVYVSCAGRGGPHFGAPSAELAIVRRMLGDVPLVGFFAAGEIGHRHLYGYTGVLTAFGAA